jgi:hypothetical protein
MRQPFEDFDFAPGQPVALGTGFPPARPTPSAATDLAVSRFMPSRGPSAGSLEVGIGAFDVEAVAHEVRRHDAVLPARGAMPAWFLPQADRSNPSIGLADGKNKAGRARL